MQWSKSTANDPQEYEIQKKNNVKRSNSIVCPKRNLSKIQGDKNKNLKSQEKNEQTS